MFLKMLMISALLSSVYGARDCYYSINPTPECSQKINAPLPYVISLGYFIDSQPHDKEKPCADNYQYDPYSDTLYRRYLGATILGAFLSVVVIGMLVWQNILTRRVAKAAKDSADALTSIERPWILIESVGYSRQGSKDVSTWKFKNCGKTPARIVEVGSTFKTVQKLEDLPSEPEYGRSHNFTDYTMFAPDAESNFIDTVYDSVLISDEQRAQLRSEEAFLLIFGIVKYTDTFGKPRETRFCYRMDKMTAVHKETILVGPRAYNRHT